MVISPLCKSLMSSHEFFFWWENKWGVCVHRKWALGHGYIMPKCPGGDISMISQAEKPWGVSQPGGVSRHFTPVHPKGPDSFVST